MAKRPFREARAAASDNNGGDGGGGGDKSEFEDKVHQDGDIFKQRIDVLIGKLMNPKPEKDEGAEKFGADKSRKDSKDNKHEKLEKEHKDLLKEFDHGGIHGGIGTLPVFGAFGEPAGAQNAQMLARIAALEAEIGALKHFIGKDQRPNIAKGALKDEPDQQ
ncbi:hypothetical protein [Phenylobacterium sp.]|uniref:hypothetical protein n=1 Tax=Phenylobacterium sp. TaxID=1871053 RepID=UPI0025E67751|nr:hypothetical protein [Phenylobacterium sp.]